MPLDLFTAAGQSNMIGQGDQALSPDPATDTAFEWDLETDSIIQLDDPVGYNPDANTGSCLPQFAVTYYNLTGRKVGIVQTAKGGASQCQEVQSKTWDPEASSLYDQAITDTQAAITGFENAGYSVSYRGVLWNQGEADAQAIDDGTIGKSLYKTTFEQMIDQWRTDMSDSDMPFFICQTGIYPPDDTAGFQDVRDAQAEIAGSVSDCILASWIQRFFDKGDNSTDRMNENVDNDVHYNQEGLNDMGDLAGMSVAKWLDENSRFPAASAGVLKAISGSLPTNSTGVIVAESGDGGVSVPSGPAVAEFEQLTEVL